MQTQLEQYFARGRDCAVGNIPRLDSIDSGSERAKIWCNEKEQFPTKNANSGDEP